ncbi:MAG: cytochrome c oxidase assembly protein [Streptomyces albidoflavus]
MSSSRRTPSPLVLLPAALGAGLVTLLVVLAVAGGTDAAPLGLPDPGALVRWGLPLLGWVDDLLAVVVVACLVVPALTMRRSRDALTPTGTRAVRTARLAAVAWLLVIVATAWFTVADQFAQPVQQVSLTTVRGFLFDAPQGTSLLWQFALVAALACLLGLVRAPRGALLSLGLALAAVVPPLLTGHSASSGSHDTAVVALLLHVLPAVVWVGGVLALWWHLGADEKQRVRAAGRFSKLAAWCLALTAASGVASAYVRLGGLGDFVTSGYGRAALVKVLLIVVIGLVAARLRTLLRAGGTPDWRTFAGLSAVELTAMSAAIGLGVALSRTPPPVGEPYVSVTESLLGGPLPPAPTLSGLLLSFRPSGVGLAIVVLGAVAYVVGVLTLRRRGDAWPVGRTISWFLGLAAVAYATMGGLGVWSHVMFSAHMGSHMVLSMIAPVLLVLGAPIPLALRALPGSDVPGGEGPRQLLAAFLNSWYGRLVTHPAFAAVMFVGSLYVIYFTGLYEWLMGNHLGHAFMEFHFLMAGYLYYEVLVGSAPLAKRPPFLGRLGMLVMIAPFHAFFAIAVMNTTTVIGGDYYSALQRPYATDLLADQNLGGGMTWALGEVPLLMVALVLLFQWFRDDSRRAAQSDRRAERDEDAELQRYNAMLGRIGRGEASRLDRDPATRGLSDAEPEGEPAAHDPS